MNAKRDSFINPRALAFAAGLSMIVGILFLQRFFVLIVLSAIVAYLMNPVYQFFLRKSKNKISRSILLTLIIFVFAITIPLSALLYVTVNQAIQLIGDLRSLGAESDSISAVFQSIIDPVNRQLNQLPGLGDNLINLDQLLEWFRGALSTILSSSVHFATSLMGSVGAFFTNAIIFIFVFNSLLRNQRQIVSILSEINPLGKKANSTYLQKMGSMTTAMVKGQFVIAFFQAISGVISLWIVGIDYLTLWFMLLVFLSIIPLGGGILLIPLGVGMILVGNVWQGILILLFHFVITTNIDNVLRPKFVPKNARLDPALTILSVFSGLAMFGFLGIVIGPVIMIVIITTLGMYADYRRSISV